MKYVWLNIRTGQFSNPWNEEEEKQRQQITTVDASDPFYKEWKLIKYECVNDPAFDFYNMMKIVTNAK